MKTFICQKVDGEVTLDFVLAVKNCVDYSNWINEDMVSELKYVESVEEISSVDYDTIPVGTVEFVEEFYKVFHGIERIDPIGIPEELLSFAKRRIWYGDQSEEIKEDVFCKSIDKVKGFTDIVNKNTKLLPGRYMFSELVDIESEWRCFVYRGELVGIHNYINSLDMNYYPNIDEIKRMIRNFDKLDAYTVDVGVNDQGTFLIEVHDFYSCGLYGFRDYAKLFNMFVLSHNQKIRRHRGGE